MKKIIITLIFALVALISIFSGVAVQKNHSEKYVQTYATLMYEEKKTKMPSKFTYVYSADGKKYTATKDGGIKRNERRLSYKKALPSKYHFGHITLATKVLFFVGILSAMIFIYAVFAIFNLSFAGKIPPCIFLYYVAGIAFLTESFIITAITALFTIAIIAVCLTAKDN